MPSSTYMTFLMGKKSSESAFTKMIDITSFPDLGGEPDNIDVTTLSDDITRNINGVKSLDTMSFEANYDKDTYDALAASERTEQEYAVWFGGTKNADGTVTPTGTEGKWMWTGEHTVFVRGGGVGEARGITISIAATTPIVVDKSSETP